MRDADPDYDSQKSNREASGKYHPIVLLSKCNAIEDNMVHESAFVSILFHLFLEPGDEHVVAEHVRYEELGR